MLPGWCVLFLKDHAEHLHELDDGRQARLWQDVTDAARAIVKATGARRINYECLGNQLAHIHWHVIPRFEPPIDPDPKNVVWVRPAADLACGVSPERRIELIGLIRQAGGWRRP
jgi:diadenosine tetraphosphate (Ap4A) HIT family hydrolase